MVTLPTLVSAAPPVAAIRPRRPPMRPYARPVTNSPLTGLKTAYAAGARATGRVLVKTQVMSEEPPQP